MVADEIVDDISGVDVGYDVFSVVLGLVLVVY